jgi:hypothetical protein
MQSSIDAQEAVVFLFGNDGVLAEDAQANQAEGPQESQQKEGDAEAIAERKGREPALKRLSLCCSCHDCHLELWRVMSGGKRLISRRITNLI